MDRVISCFRLLIFGVMSLLLASCASNSLKPPGPEVQTILVLPFNATNSSSVPFGHYYEYQISAADSPETTVSIDLYLPGNGDYLLVDTLSPGTYYLRDLINRRVGDGDRYNVNRSYTRNDAIVLEQGTITFFDYTLYVSQRPSGTHGGKIYWSGNYQLNPTSSAHRERILKQLRDLRYFEEWEVN